MGQISFRINNESKKEFEELCEQPGMTPTTALTIFIKKMCREKRIPFDVSLYNFQTQQAMKEAIQQENLSHSFETTKELFEELE